MLYKNATFVNRLRKLFTARRNWLPVLVPIFLFFPQPGIASENFDFFGNWDLGEGNVVLQIERAQDEDALLVRYCSRRAMLERGVCTSKEYRRFIYSSENGFYLYEDGNKNHLLHAWIFPSDNSNQIIYEFKSRWAQVTRRIGNRLNR